MHKFLFSERLKRAALFVLLVCVAGTAKSLAQTQVATLQHGEETSAFYGISAFVEAHTAAESGDIITLSSGTFTPCIITKAITLRGAGCAVDTAANTTPTTFGGDIILYVEDTTGFLSIEGILFTNRVTYKTLYNPQFTKCSFTSIDYDYNFSTNNTMHNAQFVNCIIDDFSFRRAENTVLINSVVWDANEMDYNAILMYNSIMRIKTVPRFLYAYNSIFIKDDYNWLYSACSSINCIGIDIGDTNSLFENSYTSGCVTYYSYEEVFETFTGDFSLEEQFVLKDEIATGFLGTDDTQVGIYGGTAPYSPYPNYMVRSNVTVAPRSTIDGQLNIEVEIIEEGE